MNDSIAANPSTWTGRMVSVKTGARLHFGLLSTSPPFGGAGVMVDRPQTEIIIRSAPSFQCSADVADRIVPIAKRVQRLTEQTMLPACAVEVSKRAQPHAGLGSGTQLAVAVAEGLAHYCGLKLNPDDLAIQVAGRGKRSAVGVHGYFCGGLIYEDADQPCDLNPCRNRVSVPHNWCVGLFQPTQVSAGISGQLEQRHFQALRKTNNACQQALTAMINEEMIPASNHGDFAAFADAVHRYNYQSGLLFQNVQGGPYNGSSLSELIELLMERSAVGVGQSSWGPTVFAWFEDHDQATAFQRDLPPTITTVAIAKPLNQARSLSETFG